MPAVVMMFFSNCGMGGNTMTDDDLDLELAASNPEYRRRAMDQLNRDKGTRPGSAEPIAGQGDIGGTPVQPLGDGEA